jgi:hypothetical protein
MSNSQGAIRIARARRLKWLCEEMLLRQEEEKDTRKFGAFGHSYVQEAAELAALLGFRYPPIRYRQQEFDPQKPTKLLLPPDLGAGEFGYFRTIFFCTTFDPATGSVQEVITGSIVDIVAAGRPFTYDPYQGTHKIEARSRAARHLKQWQRAMDGIIETTIEIVADPSPPTGDKSGTTAIPKRISNAMSLYREVVERIGEDSRDSEIYAQAKLMAQTAGVDLQDKTTWLRYVRDGKRLGL